MVEKKSSIILGISAYYHDAAAALVIDGEVIAAAQEERFTRVKHDPSFPGNAVTFCLDEAGCMPGDVDYVVFYDKPLLKWERLVETYFAFAPKGLTSFVSAMQVWIKEKLFFRRLLHKELKRLGFDVRKVHLLFSEHHLSHAASAFFPSPFQDAAILTIDGVGEWASASLMKGEGNRITKLKELHFPSSVGLLYSAFTYYMGFRVNSGEYKLMGLAPYGDPASHEVKVFVDLIKGNMVHIFDDGSIFLEQKYFSYAAGMTMTNDIEWERLLGVSRRSTDEAEFTQRECNLALAMQMVTEEIVIKLARHAKKVTGMKHLCLAGGVALNCVANSKLLDAKIFNDVWIQPAAGDAGGALGAALGVWHIYLNQARTASRDSAKKNTYLGPAYGRQEVRQVLKKYHAIAEEYPTERDLCAAVASLLANGEVVGWVQGRMEWGPRALGNRSILADARGAETQKRLNLKIKFRESFRPFAPIVLLEKMREYFIFDRPSPYMLFVAPVVHTRRNTRPKGYETFSLRDRLYTKRSDIPAVTHLDYSARLQTVTKEDNPVMAMLLEEFARVTGYALLVNTSFNVRGEPIVCTPTDAYLCFMRTEMDYLVVGNFVFKKTEQPSLDASARAYVYRPD